MNEKIVLSPQQITLVQDSFAGISLTEEALGHLFYGRLFEVAPHLRPLFIHDLTTQGRKFIATLSFIVATLDKPDQLMPTVQNLGRSHAGYGALPDSFEILRGVLLWTLLQGLGVRFTPEVKAAWTTAFDRLSHVMQESITQA